MTFIASIAAVIYLRVVRLIFMKVRGEVFSW